MKDDDKMDEKNVGRYNRDSRISWILENVKNIERRRRLYIQLIPLSMND